MRARAAPSFETRAAPAPQDEAAQRIPSALAARRRTVRRNPISRFQTAHIYSFPRRISASGVCDFASPAPKRGVGGAPRNVRVRARHPWGVSCASQTRVNALMTRYARRLRGACVPYRGTLASRRSTVAVFHPGPRFRLRHCLRIRTASSSQPGRSAWRATSRASRGEQLRAAAAGRHASLRLQDRL